MGLRRKLGALLGRGFDTSKFKATLNLAVSRLAVLKNHRLARCSVARSDVVEFLKSGSQDRALLRVEQVIKEQNMVDVYGLLEGYCLLLMERAGLVEAERVCPDELVEAASSLIHASSRCGDFPELQEIRKLFASQFGKEFVAKSVELRNNCGVNPKMLQKLSTRTPILETKTNVLEEIASDHNIVLAEPLARPVDQQNLKPTENTFMESESFKTGESTENSVRSKEKYKNVAHAAQVAFESAAYAAAAARAAVELSKAESIPPR